MRNIFLLLVVGCWLSIGSAAAQTAPKVTTNVKYARGATMAFGRMTASGTNIKERGFCYATHPEPTVDDNTTKKTMAAGNGTVYVLEGLEPATMYYMRAYAKNTNGDVGYGDVIKFCTVPKGKITYSYNNGGNAAQNTRINNALTQACDIFCNLTSIQKHFNVGYGSGTPTADCNYQDQPWMNVGPNESYQKTGTIMHEMQHGLGVINYSTQWAGNIMRSGNGTGNWVGERVSAFLDFWDNTSGSFLHGDTQHMWPYGINGAHEDDGSLKTYYANAMIGQALGEDGLQHCYNTFADPYYAFEQEDDVKYYLKNEDEERGLYTSYLIPTSTGMLKWRAMSAAEALQNDSAAWYITFTPSNQYYQLRNAATGQYMTYSSGFKTINHSTPNANDDFHLMKGRVDVSGMRGYWLIHPSGNWTPSCLAANANGATASKTFDLSNTATQQRWLILSADDIQTFESSAMTQLKAEVSNVLMPIKALYDVPHTTEPASASQAFADAISSIEQRMNNAAGVSDLTPLADEARQAALDFLNVATPTDIGQPFDLTYMIKNQGMDASDGWSVTPAISYSCAEFYEKTFDFNQTVRNLPNGTFRVMVQGFQRPGTYTQAYNDYAAGTNNVNASFYFGSKSVKMRHIAEDAQTRKLGVGSEVLVGGKYYVPDNMQAAANYFKKGFYENEVVTTLSSTSTSLKIGLRCSSMPSRYWVIFDNFRLYFYGSVSTEVVTNINTATTAAATMTDAVYTLDGRRVTSSTQQLKPGLYIVNGRKTVVK